MTGELLDAILITIPLWGPLVFVMAADLSDTKICRENRQRRRGHGF